MGEVRLRLDAERWREHLGVVSRATPGLVPVIKGNGYGFGRARLAKEAADLGVDTIAVGVASRGRPGPAAVRRRRGDPAALGRRRRRRPGLPDRPEGDHHGVPAERPGRDRRQRPGAAGAGRGADLDAPARHPARPPGRRDPAAAAGALRGLEHPPAAAGGGPLRRGRGADPGRGRGDPGDALAVAPAAGRGFAAGRRRGIRAGRGAAAGRHPALAGRRDRTGRPWPRCSTCTPYAGASGRVTAGGSCPPTGGSWWSPAAPRTASGWRPRRRR